MSEATAALPRPIKLTIAALGGQGGGVLTTWLIQVAEAEGYLAQSTSVPGVAQRTGATIYYLEFFPRALAEHAGREPIMALMPVPGDVDCVVASELVEAGRAIQRGLVTPNRTTLIASSHRSYAITEKSAMGDGTADTNALTELVRSQSKRLVLFDMEAVAEQHQSVISSVLLGAICGSGVLPFAKKTFERVIESSGIAVKTNLAAFADAYLRGERGDAQARPEFTQPHGTTQSSATNSFAGQAVPSSELRSPSRSVAGHPAPLGEMPTKARSAELQPLLDRVRAFPGPLQMLVLVGVRRAIDYQDPAYADLYLNRLERIAALDGSRPGENTWALTEATARGLALWMTFEDTIRVADLKTRAARFARVGEEIRADKGQLFGITEFMKPRVAEIAGTLPAGMGRWVLGSPRLSRWIARWTGGKQVRTSTITGFLMLHGLQGLRRWRRGTLRFQQENARIEQWLDRIERLAVDNYSLAVEVSRAQRLVKGYGDTHERGLRNFTALLDRLDALAVRSDGAAVLARLQAAALADEEGKTLARELAAIPVP